MQKVQNLRSNAGSFRPTQLSKNVRNLKICRILAFWTTLLWVYLPTHGLTQRDLCQPIQSYSSLKSAAVPSQPQLILNSVPRMSIMPRRQASGAPEQLLVLASTEHAWLNRSSRSRHSGLLLQARATVWQATCWVVPPTSYPMLPSGCCAQTGCRNDCARIHCSSWLGVFL